MLNAQTNMIKIQLYSILLRLRSIMISLTSEAYLNSTVVTKILYTNLLNFGFKMIIVRFIHNKEFKRFLLF